MKKKLLSMTLALCLVFGTASALPQGYLGGSAAITASAAGDTFTVGDIQYYSPDNKTAGVCRYNGSGGNVTIPKTVNGLTVTKIYDAAFYGAAESGGVKTVTLPDTITEIGQYAFWASGLTKINLPDSLTTIGDYAFQKTELKTVTLPKKLTALPKAIFADCASLEQITVPAGIKIIGTYAFAGCSALNKVTLSKGVQRIKEGAFYNCTKLTQISLPSTVGVIGDEAFSRTGLTSITFPSSVVQLGKCCFEECQSLEKVTIGSGMQSIGKSAFNSCTALKSISLPDSITAIEANTFYYCSALKSVKLPSKLKSIGEGGFSRCFALESITLPATVTTIGASAFYDCYKLTKVNIPNGITELPDDIFNGCQELEKLTIPPSVKKLGRMMIRTTKIKQLTIPKGVTEIPKEAFLFCSLEKVDIPQGVTTIGESAFEYCGSLREVTIPNTVTAIGKNAFMHTALKTLTIPDSVKSIGKYAAGVHYYYNSSEKKNVDVRELGFRLIYGDNPVARNYAETNNLEFARRLSGSNRYATAADISKNTFESANTVVIASGEDYADALAGVPYAKSIGAPILLTTKDKLPSETLAEIKGIGAKKAVILGGTGAVSDNVIKELESNGLKTERISGSSRYATAANIAEKTNSAPDEVFFVAGTSYADALSISSVAAIKNAPVIYINKDGDINADTAKYLAKLKAKNCVYNTYFIGGKGAISDEIMKKVCDLLGANNNRISGKNRYETCIEINHWFRNLFAKGTACLATGTNFPDALAGGVFAANKYAPLILTSPTVTEPQHKYFTTYQAKSVYVFGGAGAVSEKQIRDITCLRNGENFSA